jgi:acyl-CoA thioesterase II
MEGTSGRGCVWATAQYLSYANPPSIVDIDVTIAVDGRQITQARAVCARGDREILTVNAALGERPMEQAGQWARCGPVVPPPEDCPTAPASLVPGNESIMIASNTRLVGARSFTQGRAGHARGPDSACGHASPTCSTGVDADAGILGDYVPMGIGQALGARAGGNSLDNTLRVCRIVPTEWVLMDIRVHAVERGFGHGLVHMFAEDGTLLATASQSVIVRFWKG